MSGFIWFSPSSSTSSSSSPFAAQSNYCNIEAGKIKTPQSSLPCPGTAVAVFDHTTQITTIHMVAHSSCSSSTFQNKGDNASKKSSYLRPEKSFNHSKINGNVDINWYVRYSISTSISWKNKMNLHYHHDRETTITNKDKKSSSKSSSKLLFQNPLFHLIMDYSSTNKTYSNKDNHKRAVAVPWGHWYPDDSDGKNRNITIGTIYSLSPSIIYPLHSLQLRNANNKRSNQKGGATWWEYISWIKRQWISSIIFLQEEEDEENQISQQTLSFAPTISDKTTKLKFVRSKTFCFGKDDSFQVENFRLTNNNYKQKEDYEVPILGIILPSTIITILPPKDVNIKIDILSLKPSQNDNGPISTSNKTKTQIPEMNSTMKFLYQLVEMKLNHPKLGNMLPRSIIMTGPPGVGKTFSVKTIYQLFEDKIVFLSIRGTTDLSSSSNLISTPNETSENNDKLKLLFIDECDALCSTAIGCSLVQKILDDRDEEKHNFLLVAATNHLESLPSVLRRRWDREIYVAPPDASQRYSILKSLMGISQPIQPPGYQKKQLPTYQTREFNAIKSFSLIEEEEDDDDPIIVQPNHRQMLTRTISKNDEDITCHENNDDLEDIAKDCVGYVPADLAALVRRASYSQISLRDAMNHVVASALRSDIMMTSASQLKTTWKDIAGDAGGAKLALRQAIEWPRTKQKEFERLGLVPPRGILLHGPPGCAKTTLAKAAAGAAGVAFSSLSPAQVYASSYVGEAEAVVRRAFALARSTSPCILFFDEIDSILGGGSSSGDRTGMNRSSSSAEARVLSTFLNEMDGVDGSTKDGVLVLGATNRPKTLDAALLRPGRFDRIIYVPPPDLKARRAILESQFPLSKLLDLDKLCSEDMSGKMTGAELVGACREAAMMALREELDGVANNSQKSVIVPSVRQHHLIKSLQKVKPLLSDKSILWEYTSFENEHKT